MKKRAVIFAAALAAATLSLHSQKWFEKKPFSEWSAKDASKMLSKEPWADSQVHFRSGSAAVTSAAQMSRRVRRGADSSEIGEVRTAFRGYWFSARPVRMALASLALRNNPDLNREELTRFAGEQMPDAVLALTVESRDRGTQNAALTALSEWTLEEAAAATKLTTKKGKEIPLQDYRPPEGDGTGAKFIYPRLLPDDRPLFERADEEARFETRVRVGGDDVRIRLKFKLKKMVYKGRLEF